MGNRFISTDITKDFKYFKRGVDEMAQVLFTKDGQPIDDTNALPVKEVVNRVKDKIYGTSTVTKNYTSFMTGFEIYNDGLANLTYTINGMTFDVKTGEIDSVSFDPFKTLTITATSSYRARVFG